ncbi:MAG TPA: HlyD family efflux transporter periplasmic adaptor subunit [Vicinamibacterales bacterium]|nr:HlyD family efflux transporter periplasmic adaptor subunit [Vicinamibacterales bacterium]
MVDIARPATVAKRKKIKRAVMATSGLVIIILITIGVSQLKPAAPSVDRAAVWVDTVKRGPMLRLVRGSGTLVPEDIRWINTTTQGRVERILLRPGATVTANTVILELSNPELQQSVQDAQLAHQSALASYENRKAELERTLLQQQSELASIETQYNNSALNLKAQEELLKDGLVSLLQVQQIRSQTADLKNRLSIAQKQFENMKNGMKSQLAPQEAEVSQRRAQYDLRLQQLDNLKVKAGMAGVLSQVPVEVGQTIGPGTNLARVADPTRLKAEVRIAETQTKDIRIGQIAEVDTRNGIIPGRVIRIDPTATGGTVGVDISLEGALPPGARPDLSVDGTITLEKLPDVIKVGRPAFGQENSIVMLFKLDDSGEAHRVQVRLGRTSVNEIEILEGLQPGDQVILSDMSAQDAYDRIRLNQ